MEKRQKIQFTKSQVNRILYLMLLLISFVFNLYFLYKLKYESNIITYEIDKQVIDKTQEIVVKSKLNYENEIHLVLDSLGKLKSIYQKDMGIQKGDMIIFKDFNQLAKKRFNNYKLEGVSHKFYESGIPEIFVYFIDGIRAGVGNEFYDTTGALKKIKYFNFNGECVYIGYYKNDKLIKEEGNLDARP